MKSALKISIFYKEDDENVVYLTMLDGKSSWKEGVFVEYDFFIPLNRILVADPKQAEEKIFRFAFFAFTKLLENLKRKKRRSFRLVERRCEGLCS